MPKAHGSFTEKILPYVTEPLPIPRQSDEWAVHYYISRLDRFIHFHTQSLVTRFQRSVYIKQGSAIADRPERGTGEAYIIHTKTTDAAIQGDVPLWGEVYYDSAPHQWNRDRHIARSAVTTELCFITQPDGAPASINVENVGT